MLDIKNKKRWSGANGREDVIIFFIFVLKYDIIILVYKIGEIFVLYTFVKYRGDMLSHISLFLLK